VRRAPAARFAGLLALCLCWSALACAGPLQREPETGDYEDILRRAEKGEAWAQLNLAAMYDHGLAGVARDRKQAAGWYEKAARQGLGLAQFSLGHLYALGEGVEQDFGVAFGWLIQAAKQDVSEAQYLIGVMYNEGLGVESDPETARLWLQRAVDNGQQAATEYMQESLDVDEPEEPGEPPVPPAADAQAEESPAAPDLP